MHSYNFPGSALVSMFLNCWNSENLKKIPWKYTKWSDNCIIKSHNFCLQYCNACNITKITPNFFILASCEITKLGKLLNTPTSEG